LESCRRRGNSCTTFAAAIFDVAADLLLDPPGHHEPGVGDFEWIGKSEPQDHRPGQGRECEGEEISECVVKAEDRTDASLAVSRVEHDGALLLVDLFVLRGDAKPIISRRIGGYMVSSEIFFRRTEISAVPVRLS
jgi:hypothetical protein